MERSLSDFPLIHSSTLFSVAISSICDYHYALQWVGVSFFCLQLAVTVVVAFPAWIMFLPMGLQRAISARNRNIPHAGLDPFISILVCPGDAFSHTATILRNFLTAVNDGFLHKNCLTWILSLSQDDRRHMGSHDHLFGELRVPISKLFKCFCSIKAGTPLVLKRHPIWKTLITSTSTIHYSICFSLP